MPKFSPKILQSVRNMDRVGKANGKKYYKIPCGGTHAGVELVSVLHRGENEASDHA